MSFKIIQQVPTTIIMGFLGSGKTTAILDLFTQKPADEKWAVLVNEFGAIGIDGAIYTSQGITVKEVPGGCMCCVAGVSMQVAINTLLKTLRPDRLLIEPTGLGHPRKVIDTLKGEGFRTSLRLHASICLVDPRKLKDRRYTEHENFVDQMAMADVLVANKIDQADEDALRLFDDYVASCEPKKQAVYKTQCGRLDSACLDLLPTGARQAVYAEHHAHRQQQDAAQQNDGFQSVAWVFPRRTVFSFEQLKQALKSAKLERSKGVIHTDKGWFVFNAQAGEVQTMAVTAGLDELNESRLEVINHVLDDLALEASFRACQLNCQLNRETK